MSSPNKAEQLEDWMANNDVTDDVLVEVLITHLRSEFEETGDLGTIEDLREEVRDLIEWTKGE